MNGKKDVFTTYNYKIRKIRYFIIKTDVDNNFLY